MTQSELGATVALLKVIELPPGVAASVADPPQFCREFAGKAGFASTTFAGRLSVSDVWVNVVDAEVLFIVIVSTLVSPTQDVLGENDLCTVGDWTPVTIRVALAGVVLVIDTPPPVELNALAGIVLILFPAVVDVTAIPTVHSPGVTPTCGGTVPPLSEKVVDPGAAVTLPPQEFEILAGLAIDNPGWTPTKLSVQEELFNENEFGL
jgi:hypothetical protein